MKALLMAAAILAPALALANDPAMQKGNVTDMTSTQVLGKLRHINETSVEMAGIASSNSQSAAVKSLASRMSAEHQKLDKRVTDYATKNNIVLSSGELKEDVVPLTPSQATTYDRDRGPATERPGAVDRDTSTGSMRSQMGSNDRLAGPGAMGYRGATEAGSEVSAEKGKTTDRMASDAPALTGSEAYPEVPGTSEQFAKHQAAMDQLRGLNGTAFDREFLSRVVEKGNKWIGVLQNSKGKFDKTIDGQISSTLDTLKKEVSDAQRLQATLRAS